MNRREFFDRTLPVVGACCVGCTSFGSWNTSHREIVEDLSLSSTPPLQEEPAPLEEGIGLEDAAVPPPEPERKDPAPLEYDPETLATNSRAFDRSYPEDIHLSPEDVPRLNSCVSKLARVQNYVGYGHFNLISFKSLLHYSKHGRGLQAWTREELDFIERIFHFEASAYGFYGERVNFDLNEEISRSSVYKVPGSGHYLYKDWSLSVFNRIRGDIPSIVLTSGVRSVVKQLYLFLAKLKSLSKTQGEWNLSQASRSLAPPGYSYHAAGDFDVGKYGLGRANFTHKFSETKEYGMLQQLGYVTLRYPNSNPYGVRFEPWHIGRIRNVSSTKKS